jgi:probable HAF family extracellular repeat protein
MAKKEVNSNRREKIMKLFIAAISLSLSVAINAEEAKSIKYNTANGSQIIIKDLGLIPGGTTSSGLAINNQPVIVGLANDSTFALQRPFWDANTGGIIGFADNFNPASTAIPEHVNGSREMAGTEVYGDNVYQGIYWNPTGQAFVLPPLAGFDPDYGSLHTRSHGINNLGQLVGTGKEGSPNFYTHAALWPNKDTEAMDLGFLGQGIPLNYSEAYGVNDLSHVVGNSAIGSFIHGFLWRNGQMTDLGALSGQVASEARAINNAGLIAGKSNIFPVVWKYDATHAPRIQQLPIPAGFFSATTTAVNDSGDVVGYAGSPNIDSHAILWRGGMAVDLGVWPGGHYSVANGINNLGQIVGTGTVAGDNLDHALMWTVDDGSGGIPCEDLLSFQARCQSGGGGHKLQAKVTLTNTSHSGEQVTITVDGNPTAVTINGNKAQLSINNPAPGEHTIELTDPAGCFPPMVPSCN